MTPYAMFQHNMNFAAVAMPIWCRLPAINWLKLVILVEITIYFFSKLIAKLVWCAPNECVCVWMWLWCNNTKVLPKNVERMMENKSASKSHWRKMIRRAWYICYLTELWFLQWEKFEYWSVNISGVGMWERKRVVCMLYIYCICFWCMCKRLPNMKLFRLTQFRFGSQIMAHLL